MYSLEIVTFFKRLVKLFSEKIQTFLLMFWHKLWWTLFRLSICLFIELYLQHLLFLMMIPLIASLSIDSFSAFYSREKIYKIIKDVYVVPWPKHPLFKDHKFMEIFRFKKGQMQQLENKMFHFELYCKIN